MPRVVGVRFRKVGKIYSFDAEFLAIRPGEGVIVETARGIEYGEAVVGPREVPETEVVAPLRKILRRATDKDLEQLAENRRRQEEAFRLCHTKIQQHGLEMDLVDAELTFDQSRAVFYFTAENRVDFRELVRDLAASLKTRVELRQIGVRDEAKLLGGIGPCGRELCCTTWLTDFEPVSIKMAKEQQLALNPSKISGLCGRLMCCLRYESLQALAPPAAVLDVGTAVTTPDGEGRVLAHDPGRGAVSVCLAGGEVRQYSVRDVDEKTVEEVGPVRE